MKKVTVENAVKISKKLNRWTYMSNPFYLESNCFFVDSNNDLIIYEKDVYDNNKMKPLFLPSKKENIIEQVSLAFEEDIMQLEKQKIPVIKKELWGYEYVYNTQEFIEMKGKKFKAIRKLINNFENNNKFIVLEKYPKDKIIAFLEKWRDEKLKKERNKVAKQSFDSDFKSCLHELDILDKIPCNQIYVELDNKLIGMAIFLEMHKDLWVCLMQKIDTQYKGLDRYLYKIKSKKMAHIPYFTTGASAQDEGLTAFKEQLRPCKKIPLYVIEMDLFKK